MNPSRQQFVCLVCNASSTLYEPSCPSCNSPNTLKSRAQLTLVGPQPMRACSVTTPRIRTGLASIDKALGGGFVPGTAITLGGDPGAGKSTLALFLAASVPGSLYVASEEERVQIEERMTRTAPIALGTPLIVTKSLGEVLRYMGDYRLTIVDSLHMLEGDPLEMSKHLLARIRETGGALLSICHLTHEGHVRGTKTLEYLYDCNLHIEITVPGQSIRDIVTKKNRFGPAITHRMLLGAKGWTELPLVDS